MLTVLCPIVPFPPGGPPSHRVHYPRQPATGPGQSICPQNPLPSTFNGSPHSPPKRTCRTLGRLRNNASACTPLQALPHDLQVGSSTFNKAGRRRGSTTKGQKQQEELPMEPFPDDDEEGLGSNGSHTWSAAARTEASSQAQGEGGLFQNLAGNTDKLPPPPLAHTPPAGSIPVRSSVSVIPQPLPPSLAQAALERSNLGTLKKRGGQGSYSKRSTESMYQDGSGRKSGWGDEAPQDPDELRARYNALKLEYEALRGMMQEGGQHKRRLGRLGMGAPPNSVQADLQDASRAPRFARGAAHTDRGRERFMAARGGLQRVQSREGERILSRLAISSPHSTRISNDTEFVKELQLKVHAMPAVVQPALQEAVQQLQVYCSEQSARHTSAGSTETEVQGVEEAQASSKAQHGQDRDAEDGATGGEDADAHRESSEKVQKEGQQEPFVYHSEVEVVSDAVEIMLGSRLPEKAFYGARAHTLMQLDLEDVKVQCTKWKNTCGLAYARHFLVKEPRLLAQDPARLLRYLEMFSVTLHLQPQECVAFAVRNSTLVAQDLTKEQLEGAVSELAGVIGEPEMVAAKLMTRCTLLLTLPHGSITARFEALAALLPVTRTRLAAACSRRPLLLLGSVQRLAANMVGIASLLSVPLSKAALVISCTPGILGSQPARLVGKWRAARALASMYVPWAQQVAEWREPTLGRCLTVREEAFNRPKYLLRHGMQVLPQAANFKRLLTMSNRNFHSNFIAPYPPRTIYSRIMRFPKRTNDAAARAGMSGSAVPDAEAGENSSDRLQGNGGSQAVGGSSSGNGLQQRERGLGSSLPDTVSSRALTLTLPIARERGMSSIHVGRKGEGGGFNGSRSLDDESGAAAEIAVKAREPVGLGREAQHLASY